MHTAERNRREGGGALACVQGRNRGEVRRRKDMELGTLSESRKGSPVLGKVLVNGNCEPWMVDHVARFLAVSHVGRQQRRHERNEVGGVGNRE